MNNPNDIQWLEKVTDRRPDPAAGPVALSRIVKTAHHGSRLPPLFQLPDPFNDTQKLFSFSHTEKERTGNKSCIPNCIQNYPRPSTGSGSWSSGGTR